jgi:hypothetical protein
MDEIETTESLDVLLSYVMSHTDEHNFYSELCYLSAAASSCASADLVVYPESPDANDTLRRSIRVIDAMLRNIKYDSLAYQLAKTGVERSKILLGEPDPKTVQKIFDLRKSYLMKYTKLERQFLEKLKY